MWGVQDKYVARVSKFVDCGNLHDAALINITISNDGASVSIYADFQKTVGPVGVSTEYKSL